MPSTPAPPLPASYYRRPEPYDAVERCCRALAYSQPRDTSPTCQCQYPDPWGQAVWHCHRCKLRVPRRSRPDVSLWPCIEEDFRAWCDEQEAGT